MIHGSNIRTNFLWFSLLILLRIRLLKRAIFKLRNVNKAPSTPPIIPKTAVGINARIFVDKLEST